MPYLIIVKVYLHPNSDSSTRNSNKTWYMVYCVSHFNEYSHSKKDNRE